LYSEYINADSCLVEVDGTLVDDLIIVIRSW
jgi:hypothetical protein